MEMNKGSYLHNELNDVRLEKQWKQSAENSWNDLSSMRNKQET